MSPKFIVTIIVVCLILLVGGVVVSKCIGIVDSQEWIFVQPYWGEARIQNGSGMYWKGMADTWSYPRYMELVYSDEAGEGDKDKESIKVTFNDGSTADINAFMVIETPTVSDDQIVFHKQMNGDPRQIKSKTKAHLTECMKSTAPLMSSTEHQVSRKSEYSMAVENQLSDGVYDMKQIRKVLADRVDEQGKPVSVAATEVLLDEKGRPVIAKLSPLTTKYKMSITQFSIKGTKYDPETLKQFAAKKGQFLAAEKSKAEREAMVQEALKIEAEGLKDKAQAEATANVLMATAVIAAEKEANVALQNKIKAETIANQQLSVAAIVKEEKLTIANMNLEVAQIKALEAEQEKIAEILRAQGRKEAIDLSGDITELEAAMIEAEVEKVRVAAKALASVQSPEVLIINGTAEGKGGNSLMENLISMKLMADAGILKEVKVNSSEVEERVNRNQE